jgi:hypothetical protein
MRRPPTRRLPGSYADVFRTFIPRRLRDLLDEGADTGSRCIGRRNGRKHKHVPRRQARSSRVWAIGAGMTRIALEPHRSEPEMSVDGVDVRKLPAERLRHRHDLFRVVIEEHETRLRHRDKRAICRPRDAEDDVAAILVEIHDADFEAQLVSRVGFSAIGSGEIGHDDTRVHVLHILDADIEQEACAGLGNHGDHRVVAEVVRAVDIGDAHREMCRVVKLVFGKL